MDYLFKLYSFVSGTPHIGLCKCIYLLCVISSCPRASADKLIKYSADFRAAAVDSCYVQRQKFNLKMFVVGYRQNVTVNIYSKVAF